MSSDWVIKNSSGRQVGGPMPHDAAVEEALRMAGSTAYARPENWREAQNGTDIWATPSKQECESCSSGGCSQPSANVVFHVQKAA